MGGDQRRPLRAGGAQSRFEPFLDSMATKSPRADGDGVVAGLSREVLIMLERQLDAGEHEQVVEPARPFALGRDLVEIANEVRLAHAGVGLGV